ncbi:hypothetical protein J1P26_21840 [Neobacillus sp. MM2021_6]|uniref:hypothetical protein n=1 Tax=Bacillaceae TaxID=186817 RepID=UPI00140D3D1F|nr:MULTISPECIES: hypothetical protein [Bacillaceae]MBO0962349.1 hypothetical protein [Neobacillus sp. MM2021_6]NHC20832.1 hypothetical protein [Bacillus sp. MM2020_4]
MGEATVLHLPVRVTVDNGQDVNLDLINRHTLEPVTSDEIFTFSGVCSNDSLDSYFTRMDPITTLRNYADDLKNGVALQEGHNVRINPYGRSYDGILIPAGEDANTFNSVRGHWYLMRGLTINGNHTDDTIRAIKAGIIRDMSVGFTDESYRCGSCGRDLWDWECPHIPGLEDEQGRISFAWIVDARLREVSTVYKGACPGAYIDKAREYVSQGELALEKVQRLERRFQVRLDDGKRSIFMPKKEERSEMNLLEQIRTALKEGKIERRSVYDALSTEGEVFRQPEDVQLRNELGDAATVEGVKQLKTEAEQGRQYAADLIDQAVQARVKAQGDGFDSEKYRSMLVRAADLDFVKEEIKSYGDLAAQRFTPGRQTNPIDPGTRGQGIEDEEIIVSENFKGEGK